MIVLSENASVSCGTVVCCFTNSLSFPASPWHQDEPACGLPINTIFQTIVLNHCFKLSFYTGLILMKIPLLSSYFLWGYFAKQRQKKDQASRLLLIVVYTLIRKFDHLML
jgi:hypothetical protein